MWEREIELIESLGKLYPEFISKYTFFSIKYREWIENNMQRAWWVYRLCKYHLNRRLPILEEFIKENSPSAWDWYKLKFEITDEQCGKKS